MADLEDVLMLDVVKVAHGRFGGKGSFEGHATLAKKCVTPRTIVGSYMESQVDQIRMKRTIGKTGLP